MMNMTEEKLCEKKMFARKYTWKKEWVRPYESSFSILLTFCKINTIDAVKAERLLGDPDSDKRYADIFLPDWYVRQMQPFLNLDERARDKMMENRIVYCPICRLSGYHSIFHQLYNMRVCPFHNITLEYDMPELEFGVSYSIESIIYKEDYKSLANARDTPHPSLRTEDRAVQGFVFKTHKMANYVSDHIYFPVYDGCCENMEFRKNTVFPYNFMSDVDSYKCFRVKHFEGTDNDLLAALQTGQYALPAIQKFEADNSTNCTLMGYWHWIYRQVTCLSDLYIYCLFKNLIGDSLEKPAYKHTYVMYNDILHYHDTLKLKLSFIWSIKGSMDWQDGLSYYWTQHPDSGVNWNYRHIRNGIRLEALGISLRQGFSLIDKTLIELFIIDDLFKCLWRQYKILARRPQGVSVWDGWRELRVPEYYICQKKRNGTMYLYRKKQF